MVNWPWTLINLYGNFFSNAVLFQNSGSLNLMIMFLYPIQSIYCWICLDTRISEMFWEFWKVFKKVSKYSKTILWRNWGTNPIHVIPCWKRLCISYQLCLLTFISCRLNFLKKWWKLKWRNWCMCPL